MTVKQFFKGKAFKSIVVLLCVLLVSGILLSVCWGFLEVTDKERFDRKINAMYGGETVTATEQDISDKNTSVSGAYVQNVWYIEEKSDYLVQAASRGYGGDIICWVAVTVDADKNVTGIRKVIKYAVKDAAELIGNIGDEVYEKFSTDYVEGKVFDYGTEGTSEYIKTGASHTLGAICNCVNGSVEFVKAYASGGSVADPYANYTLKDYIDMDSTSWTVNNGVVSYRIVTTAYPPVNAFTITLDVGADKKVANYTITVNGSKPKGETNYEELMDASVKDGSLFNGKQLSFFTDFYGADMAYKPVTAITDGSLVTGASVKGYPSKSTYLCASAAAFALANYDTCVTAPKGGN